jgi:hypothetical protein
MTPYFTICGSIGAATLLRYVINRQRGDANAAFYIMGFRVRLKRNPPILVYFAQWLVVTLAIVALFALNRRFITTQGH